MSSPFASLVTHLFPELRIGPRSADRPHRFAADGLRWGAEESGAPALRVDRVEWSDARLDCGPLTLECERLTATDVRLAWGPGGSGPASVTVGGVDLSRLRMECPLTWPRPVRAAAGRPAPPPANAWRLAPLAEAQGELRASITDAQWLFDADVAVPLRGGRIDFNEATVEHVGPDSRMGVSRLGVYVDAPNGRTYLYQFATPPVSGVAFERRGALLGAWVSDRGGLDLQPFAEAMLRQSFDTTLHGLTAQARQLLGRTAVQGEVRLGDGDVVTPVLHAKLVAAGAGHNVMRLQGAARGRGLALEIAALSLADVSARLGSGTAQCATLAGGVRGDVSLGADGVARVTLAAESIRLGAIRATEPSDNGHPPTPRDAAT